LNRLAIQFSKEEIKKLQKILHNSQLNKQVGEKYELNKDEHKKVKKCKKIGADYVNMQPINI
jgi:hypothetical protein